MKTIIFFASFFFSIGCTSSKSLESFSSFDFLPTSTENAEANGFLKRTAGSSINLPFSGGLNVSSICQRQHGDTLAQLFFDEQRVVARAIVFPLKSFDSTALITNLRKVGDVMLHGTTEEAKPIGAFRRGSDVYFIFKTAAVIALLNRPGEDKTTRPPGPLVEPARAQ